MSLARAAVPGVLLCLVVAAGVSQQKSSASSPLVRSMERKIEHIESNAQARPPDPKPTTMTEDEVNAYINSGAIELPKGVHRVRLQGIHGAVTGNTRVNFDEITQGSHSMNPLLMLFSGVHDVEVAAHAHGEHGQGYVHVDRVTIDDLEVPQVALQYFIDHYIKPKHPEIGIDSQFKLPDRIDTVTVGEHQLTVVQR